MQFKGTTVDELVYIDPDNDAVGLGTSDVTFQFQQIGGSPFTSNPRMMIEVGLDGNDTAFVARAQSDTPAKAGLIEFLRARANQSLPAQFDTVGGFRAGIWDTAKYLGSTGLFFTLDATPALNYAPIALDFRAGDGFAVSTVILKGSSTGNLGLRTGLPIATITAEGSTVWNYSRVDADYRIAGNGISFPFYYDAGNDQINFGGASSGSRLRMQSDLTHFNRLKQDKNFRISSTTHNKIMWMDAGLNVIGFGTAYGTEWIKGSSAGIVINETGDATTAFRVEGDTDQNLIKTDPATNRVGVGIATPSSLLHVNGTAQTKGRIKETSRVTTSPYTIGADEEMIFVDTDGGAITVNLPAGVDGRTYKIVNTGSSGNAVTLTPNGAELLLGLNLSATMLDGDALIITYETAEGWW
jgi:hypothetical protein